jgi:hypothetical protein
LIQSAGKETGHLLGKVDSGRKSRLLILVPLHNLVLNRQMFIPLIYRYIKSLEAEIESLKSTVAELRGELEMHRTKKNTFTPLQNDPNSREARV